MTNEEFKTLGDKIAANKATDEERLQFLEELKKLTEEIATDLTNLTEE